MIRFLLRAVGFLLTALAFSALVVDGTRSIAGGRLMLYSLAEAAAWLGGDRSTPILGAVANLARPARDLAAGVLAMPAWAAAAVPGLLLLYAGRPKAAPLGSPFRRA